MWYVAIPNIPKSGFCEAQHDRKPPLYRAETTRNTRGVARSAQHPPPPPAPDPCPGACLQQAEELEQLRTRLASSVETAESQVGLTRTPTPTRTPTLALTLTLAVTRTLTAGGRAL